MQDRVSLYPGRVKLTPVEGQENVFDLVRADQPTQVGTALSKANLLRDTTAAQFGLDSSAVPDDVLGQIGKYNEYWWSLLHGEAYAYYAKKEELNTSTFSIKGTAYYSKTVSVDSSTGEITLVDKTQYLYTGSNYTTYMKTLCELAPIYFEAPDESGNVAIFHIPAGATYYDASWSSTVDYTFSGWYNSSSKVSKIFILAPATSSICARVVTSERITVPAGETTYEHSTDRNAYPDSGTVDGITYTYLGCPFEKLPTAPQIEIVSYTGTGKSGASYPNSVTFSFAPKVVFQLYVPGCEAALGLDGEGTGIYVMQADRLTTSFAYRCAFSGWGAEYGYGKKSSDGKTFYWYNTHSTSQVARQYNTSGVKYYCLAIG